MTTSYPPWQQCQLMCLHLLEVCGTAVKPPHGETCTRYEGQRVGLHSFWALRSCRYTQGRVTQTHTCSIYIRTHVCMHIHTDTCIHTYKLCKMHNVHLHLHVSHPPSPPLPTHLTTAHFSPPTVTRCELPTSKPSPDRVSTVPPATIPAVGLTDVMSRSLKENCWVDWTALLRPVASLKVSWTGPVTGPPSAGRVVQDSLRTNKQQTNNSLNDGKL